MAWLTPYVINGAAHSAALFRRQAQRPASANTGVAEPGDLKVSQLPSAGPGFRIAQGSLSLVSRFPGRSRESYGVENGDSVIDVTGITGTGSSARSDAVVLEVLDPNYLAITHEDAAATNYMAVHVVQGVPATATQIGQVPGFTDRTAYMLARIDWPAGQTAVQGSYIKDMRTLANPRRSEIVFARPRIGADDVNNQKFLTELYSTGGEYFPGGAGSPNQFQVTIPEWATRMVIDAAWMTVFYKGGEDPRGACWIEFGDEWRNHTWPNKGVWEFRTQEFGFNSPGASDNRSDNWRVMDEVPVPAKLRGKKITFAFVAGLHTKPSNTSTWMDGWGGLGCRITFGEVAIDADMV